MSNNTTKHELKKPGVFLKLKTNPILEISNNIEKKINTLHSMYNVEWSGMLICEISGSLKDENSLSKLKVKAKDLFLCDIGSQSFTSYKLTDHIDDFEKTYPALSLSGPNKDPELWWDGKDKTYGLQIGQIHTHHSMDSFFSQTDLDELFTNTENYQFYISLIVNKDRSYKAKGAVVVVNEIIEQCSSAFGLQIKKVRQVEQVLHFDFDIIYPSISKDMTPSFLSRIKQVENLSRAQSYKNKNYHDRGGVVGYKHISKNKFNNIPVVKKNTNINLADYEVVEVTGYGEVYRHTISNEFYNIAGEKFGVKDQANINRIIEFEYE